MSHFSTLRTKITDPEILKSSLRELGLTVKTEADVRGSKGQRLRVNIVAVLEGKCDLGWSLKADGSVDLIVDLWGIARSHNQTELINSIYQKYKVNKTLAESKRKSIGEKCKCPRCSSTQIGKYGYHHGKQNYICRNCGTQFVKE